MSAARKSAQQEAASQKPTHQQSGEHAIGLDAMIRRSIEVALSEKRDDDTDLQTTARMNAFDLEVALANPKARPSEAPADDTTPVIEVVEITSLPPPAVEIDRTK